MWPITENNKNNTYKLLCSILNHACICFMHAWLNLIEVMVKLTDCRMLIFVYFGCNTVLIFCHLLISPLLPSQSIVWEHFIAPHPKSVFPDFFQVNSSSARFIYGMFLENKVVVKCFTGSKNAGTRQQKL